MSCRFNITYFFDNYSFYLINNTCKRVIDLIFKYNKVLTNSKYCSLQNS